MSDHNTVATLSEAKATLPETVKDFNPETVHHRNMVSLSIDQIETDRDLQARAKPLNDEHVENLREAVRKGQERKGEPAVVFKVTEKDKNGEPVTKYLLADGFHWLAAHIREDRKRIKVELREGTRTDALRYALQANALHGLPRTTADKERAIVLCLEDPKLGKLSTAGIARVCMVGQELVARVREEWEKVHGTETTERVGADGKTRKAKINTKRRKTPEERLARESAVKLASAKNEGTAAKLARPTKGATDEIGQEIPEQLAQVFAARTDIRGLLAVLNNMEARIKALRESGALAWAAKSVESNLKALIADLEVAIPAVVYDNKHGFLSAGQWKDMSAAERKKIEKVATEEATEPEAVTAA